MPIFEFPPVGKGNSCEILPDGEIHLPQNVLDRVGWKHGMYIIPGCLTDGDLLVLLLREAKADEQGFKLSPLYRNGSIYRGGKLRCRRLTHQILRRHLELPLRNIIPIYPEKDRYPLAFMLKLPEWQEVDFSVAGAENLSSRWAGAYRLLMGDRKIYRYGQGICQSRLKEHLKDSTHARQVKQFSFFPISEKVDMAYIEHLLLVQYKQINGGQLPPGNRITA